MMQTLIPEPNEILQEMAEQCRQAAAGIPQKIEQVDEWSGVAFRMGRTRLVARLDEVVEIISYPELTEIPNTRVWVRGIANSRGSLLPVIDMNAFLGGAPLQVPRRARVLVVDHQGIVSGIAVDEVMGLRHFRENDVVNGISGVETSLQPFVKQGVRLDGRVCGIFSLMALAESPQFLQTAA
jgi:twitching motility protein PilI